MPELCNEEGFTSPAQKVKRLASHDGLDDGDHVNSFEKRGKEKAITRRLPGVRNPVTFRSQSYPSAGDLFRGNRNQTVYPRYLGRRNPFDCLDTQVTASRFGRTNELQGRPQTEHPIDWQVIPDFANFTLLNGRVDPLFWQQQWNRANALPAGAPPLRPGTLGSRRPMDRIGEAFGSFTNPRNLILTEAAINGMKGRLFGFVAPFAPNTFRTDIQNALRADNADAARDLRTVMTRIQELFVSFNYMNFPDVHDRMEGVRNDLTDSWQLIEDNIPLAAGVTEAHRAWYPDLLRRITANGRAFLTEALETLRAQAARRPFDDPIRLEVENAIFAYRLQLHELSIDYED